MAWSSRAGLCAVVLCAMVLRATAQGCDPGFTGPDGGTCVPCDKGKFKLEVGNATCSWCPAGTYSNTTGNNDGVNCTLCPEGKFSAVQGATSLDTCVDCVAGKYSPDQGEADCQMCPEGKYLNLTGSDDAGDCKVCPAGTYSNTTGNDDLVDCTLCPEGKYVETLGNDAEGDCVLCGTSKYSDSVGASRSSTCNDCPGDHYSLEIGASSNRTCKPCPKSALCNDGVCRFRNSSFACPNGSSLVGLWVLDNVTKQYVLKSCPVGFSVSALNATEQQCLPCGVGVECVREACQVCTGCQPGMFKDEVGTHACQKCPENKFDARAPAAQAAATASPSCNSCPFGANSANGSTSITDCECTRLGYPFLSIHLGLVGGICTACPAGKIDLRALGNGSNTRGCSDCSQGTYSIAGSSTCTLCATNADSPVASGDPGNCTCNTGFGGMGFSSCDECPAGKFWRKGQGAGFIPYSCETCPANANSPVRSPWCTCNMGFATLSNGSTVTLLDKTDNLEASASGMTCVACEAGKFWTRGPVKPSGFQLSYCAPCAAGKYSLPSATVCLDCAKATYNARSGSSTCSACAADATSPAASSSISDCECLSGFRPANTGPKMWQVSRESQPGLRTGLKLFGMNGTLYEFSDALYKQIPKENRWARMTVNRGPSERSHHGFAGVGDDLFVYGGCTSLLDAINCDPVSYSADFKSYRISKSAWADVVSARLAIYNNTHPGPRAFHAFVGTEGFLFLHGGLRSGSQFSQLSLKLI